MHLADTLSRAPRSSTVQQPDEEDTFDVMTVSYISSSRLEELKRHTVDDTSLQTLSTLIRHEWPRKQRNLPHAIRPYFPFRDELAINDGVIMKGHKAVIPESLHKDYISIMHRGHPGAEATRRRGRGIVFWPTMTDDINKETESCSVCNSTILHQQKRTTPATSSFRPALVNCGNRHLRMAQSAVLGASWLIFRLVWDWPASWCNLCNSYHKTTTKKHHTLSY